MLNKLFPHHDPATRVFDTFARRSVFLAFVFLTAAACLFLECWAFVNIGCRLDFDTINVGNGLQLITIAVTSRSKTSTKKSAFVNRGRILHVKSDDGLLSSSSADQQQTFRERIETNQESCQERRPRQSRGKNHHETKVCTAKSIVPHSGRHFFPSHPAYRRSFGRRLFSKLRKRKRFMEGWYYRLTLKKYEIDGCNAGDFSVDSSNKPVSFAFIISIEDPGIASSDLRLACLQAIGPNDQYLVQSTKDDTKFWASKASQNLGCTFDEYNNYNNTVFRNTITELDPDVWKKHVRSGFQIISDSSLRSKTSLKQYCKPGRWLGRVYGHDGSKGGVLDSMGVEGLVEFDFEVDSSSICGYGGYTTATKTTTTETRNNFTPGEKALDLQQERNHAAQLQKSTGGWLSSFPVFEPHWQITIADALASGSVNWNGTTYKFEDQPFYAEKNWGNALPSKWYWTQCNSFDNFEGELSVTAGGGVRKLPFGKEEELGLVAIHYKGQFYEAVPWKGNVEWNVSTWGEWSLYGDRLEETPHYGLNKMIKHKTTPPFAVEIRYRCDPEKLPGLVFRAPTPKQGMVPFCRDTFEADCELTLWELKRNESTLEFEKVEPPIIDHAVSKQGGAEIGGGPWWSEWQGKSYLKPIVKALLNFPQNLSPKNRKGRGATR